MTTRAVWLSALITSAITASLILIYWTLFRGAARGRDRGRSVEHLNNTALAMAIHDIQKALGAGLFYLALGKL